MSNLRNSQLLQQIGQHPLKSSLAKAFDIAENFQGDVEFLQLDKNLSAEGRQNAMQAIPTNHPNIFAIPFGTLHLV